MSRLILSAAVFIAAVSYAGEHPTGKEHPTGQEHPAPKKEHPAGHEHPAGKEHPAKEHPAAAKEHPKREHPAKEAPAQESAADVQKRFSEVVTAYVKGSARKNGGAFVVNDEAVKRERLLKLDRIHRNKIVKLSPDEAFACSDFRTIKGGTDMLDLDFYVKKEGGDWKVSQVLIHKVNGKPRFTYTDNNERVPVR